MPQCPPNSRPLPAEQKALLVAMKREREHVDPGRCQDAHDNLEAAKEEFYDAEASSAPAGDEELLLPAVHRLLRELEIILELGKGRTPTTVELVEEVRADV